MTDDLNPQPRTWPECPICDVPYVLRRCYSLGKGWCWCWQRDCKHKSEPRIAGEVAAGPVEASS